MAGGYLVFLDSRGMRCLGDADGLSVWGFLDSLSGRGARSSLFWVVSNFRAFVKFTGRTDLVDAAGLAGVKRFHAILLVLFRRGRTSRRAGMRVRGDRRTGGGHHLAGVDDGATRVRHRQPAAG